MNPKTWAKLPPDVQKAFDANNGEARWRVEPINLRRRKPEML